MSNIDSTSNKNESISRDFKGIWIPREIWLDNDLSLLHKAVWSEIHSLYNREKGGCFASNEYLAKFFKVSERYVREIISKLKDLGLVEEVSFDGRQRIIRALYPAQCHESERNHSSGLGGTAVPVEAEPQFRAPVYIEKRVEKSKQQPTEPQEKKPVVVVFDSLKDVDLEDLEKKSLTKKYTEERVSLAVEFSKMVPYTESLMAQLIWHCKQEVPPKHNKKNNALAKNQRIALEFNAFLKEKGFVKLAESNISLIREDKMKIVLQGKPINISLKIDINDLKNDLNQCKRELSKEEIND